VHKMWEFKNRVRVSLVVGLSNLAIFYFSTVYCFGNTFFELLFFGVGSHGQKSVLGSVSPFGGRVNTVLFSIYTVGKAIANK
jgi:hypothetical protein